MSTQLQAQTVDFTIVVPVYFNERSLPTTFAKLKEVVFDYQAKQHKRKGELIFVDDGSRDRSFEILSGLQKEHPDLVRVIKFTRNFGQRYGWQAGYTYARGKCIAFISADLQDPPQLLNEMIEYHYSEDYQIVIGTRSSRDETLYRRITSKIFYAMMRSLSFPNMPKGGFDFLLISNKVREVLLKNEECDNFFQGQILWTGYDIKFIPYHRIDREFGKSRFTFARKLKYLLDGVMGYSYLPLRLMSILGGVIALAGFLYALLIVVMRLSGNYPFLGWAPLMILILVLSGIQMLMLGVIGEYLWRALAQVRNRSNYIVEEVVQKEQE